MSAQTLAEIDRPHAAQPAAQWESNLKKWNSTAADYPRDRCIHELIEAQVARTPDHLAVRYGDESLSYAQLNAQANRVAHYLRSLGVLPDTCVGLCAERSLSMMVGLLGILKAGAAYVPLDVSYPDGRLAYMVDNSGFSLLLTHEAVRERADVIARSNPTLKILVLDDPDVQLTLDQYNSDDPVRLPDQSPENLAYVIYTSGSTGQPKGVMVEHRALVNRIDWMQKEYPIGESDVVLQKTPFSFDVSVWELTWPFITGATLVMAKPDGHRDVDYLTALIREAGVTTLHFVPSMLTLMLAESGWENCTAVRHVFCSGEALAAETVKQHYARHAAPLHNLYGPTEAAIDVSYWACPRDPDLTRVPIGKPIQNIRLYVLDEQHRLLPPGVAGELYIGGDGLARGYLNRPDLTTERFIVNPLPAEPGKRLYRTGDLALYGADGNIEYIGRIDSQVKINGLRIELGEIESQLRRHPSVASAVVLAREDVPGDKQLAAYVVLAATAGQCGAPPSPESPAVTLRKHLRAFLPAYMVPALFVFLSRIPLTPNGKVDSKALPIPEATQRRLRAMA